VATDDVNDDRLHLVMKLQAEFQARLYETAEWTTKDRADYIKDMVLAATNELQAEILPEISWKPWAKSTAFVNEEAILGECVDVLCFLLNIVLAISPGQTPYDVAARFFHAYVDKMILNNKRQDEGYDGTNKCLRCRRALDDPAVECYAPSGIHAGWCGMRNVFWTRPETVDPRVSP
jgi:hypothetical protein